jgi:hypothetical protein
MRFIVGIMTAVGIQYIFEKRIEKLKEQVVEQNKKLQLLKDLYI